MLLPQLLQLTLCLLLLVQNSLSLFVEQLSELFVEIREMLGLSSILLNLGVFLLVDFSDALVCLLLLVLDALKRLFELFDFFLRLIYLLLRVSHLLLQLLVLLAQQIILRLKLRDLVQGRPDFERIRLYGSHWCPRVRL